MEEVLRAKLLGTASVAAIVGTRVDWGIRPQGKPLPAIVLELASGVPGMTYAGPDGWSRSRVQIEHWGRTFKEAKDLADLVGGENGVLTGWRETVGGFRMRTFIMARRSDTDTLPSTLGGSDAGGPVHRTSLDALVWHARAITE